MAHTALLLVRSAGFQLIVLILTVGYLVWMVSSGAGMAQQGREKTFKQRDYNAKDPVKIVSLAAANMPLKLDEKFSLGPDWLRSTQIRLKNVSDKDVIYVELQFNFPETRTSGNEMSYRSELGNLPGRPVLNSPLLLKPDEEVSFSFTEEEYKNLVEFIGRRIKLSNISKTDLKIGFVVFADSTAWGAGLWFKANPNKPGSWIPKDTPHN